MPEVKPGNKEDRELNRFVLRARQQMSVFSDVDQRYNSAVNNVGSLESLSTEIIELIEVANERAGLEADNKWIAALSRTEGLEDSKRAEIIENKDALTIEERDNSSQSKEHPKNPK